MKTQIKFSKAIIASLLMSVCVSGTALAGDWTDVCMSRDEHLTDPSKYPCDDGANAAADLSAAQNYPMPTIPPAPTSTGSSVPGPDFSTNPAPQDWQQFHDSIATLATQVPNTPPSGATDGSIPTCSVTSTTAPMAVYQNNTRDQNGNLVQSGDYEGTVNVTTSTFSCGSNPDQRQQHHRAGYTAPGT